MGKKLKVAFILNKFPSVSETFIALQIAGLIKRGYDVSIVALGRELDGSILDRKYIPVELRDVFHDVPIYWSKWINHKSKLKKLWIFFKLFTFGLDCPVGPAIRKITLLKRRSNKKEIKTTVFFDAEVLRHVKDVDIIHCQFANIGHRIIQVLDCGFFSFTGKVIVSARGFDISRQEMLDYIDWDALFRRSSLILPVCRYFEDRLVRLGCPHHKVRVIPSPIRDIHVPEKKLGKPEHKTAFLSVGRLVEKKGFLDALMALKNLQEFGLDFSYNIIGEGPMAEELNEYIVKYSLSDNVSLIGKLTADDTLLRYQEADILLAPSKTSQDGDMEGIPNVIKEAMSAGLQIIASSHSGIPEIVKEGVTGFLFHEGDVSGLADAIIRCLKDRENWVSISNNARTLISEQYSLNASVDRLILVYSSLLGRDLIT